MTANILFEDNKHTQVPDEASWETHYKIDSDGKFSIDNKYENHRDFDGDHFVTVAIALDAEGRMVAVLKDVVGINAKFLGSPTKKESRQEGVIPSERLAQVKNVSVEHFMWDSIDDKAWWKELGKKVAENLLEWLKDTGQSGFRLP